MAAVQSDMTVKDLQAEIDTMLRRREPVLLRRIRRIAITDANIRRLFGVSMEELFNILAEKLGYEIRTQDID
jgi:hypothetical protein